MKSHFVHVRNFKDANFTGLLAYLNDVDWHGSFNTVSSVDDKYKLFLAILQHSMDPFIPMVKTATQHARLPRHLTSLARKKRLRYGKR